MVARAARKRPCGKRKIFVMSDANNAIHGTLGTIDGYNLRLLRMGDLGAYESPDDEEEDEQGGGGGIYDGVSMERDIVFAENDKT